MTKLRVITRALIINQDKILLARNRDADFWYPPGGGWEFENESILESVSREVTEETGYAVDVDSLLWIREFREPEKDKVSLETFWKTTVSEQNTQTIEGVATHVDLDANGAVEECRWFSLDDLETVKILPKFVKERILAGTPDQQDAFVDA